jgi:hypothetical protein
MSISLWKRFWSCRKTEYVKNKERRKKKKKKKKKMTMMMMIAVQYV